MISFTPAPLGAVARSASPAPLDASLRLADPSLIDDVHWFPESRPIPGLGPLELVGVRGEAAGFAVERADTARRRMRGWLGRRTPPPGLGMWLLRCDAVHTFAMRFEVDLVFVDADGRILRIDHRVRPWRIAFCIGAYSVIELAASEAVRLRLAVGDHLEVRGA